MTATFYLDPSSLLGAELPPSFHMTSSENLEKWQSSGGRQDLGSRDPLCPRSSLVLLEAPLQGGDHLFCSSFLWVWPVVPRFWRTCVPPAASLVHTGQPRNPTGCTFPGQVNPALPTLKCRGVEWVLWNVQVIPGVGGHRESQRSMMFWSLSSHFPSPH